MLDSEPAARPGRQPWSLDPVSQAPSHRAAAPQDSRPGRHLARQASHFSQLSETAPLPPRQKSPHDQPPEKDCRKMQLLVLNLHISRPKGGGMRDVGVCCPLQGPRESQLPAPVPAAPAPSVLVPEPLGLELLWATLGI